MARGGTTHFGIIPRTSLLHLMQAANVVQPVTTSDTLPRVAFRVYDGVVPCLYLRISPRAEVLLNVDDRTQWFSVHTELRHEPAYAFELRTASHVVSLRSLALGRGQRVPRLSIVQPASGVTTTMVVPRATVLALRRSVTEDNPLVPARVRRDGDGLTTVFDLTETRVSDEGR